MKPLSIVRSKLEARTFLLRHLEFIGAKKGNMDNVNAVLSALLSDVAPHVWKEAYV
jgi:hypothetical protein